MKKQKPNEFLEFLGFIFLVIFLISLVYHTSIFINRVWKYGDQLSDIKYQCQEYKRNSNFNFFESTFLQ